MISAVVITWKADALLQECLASLTAQTEPAEEVWVVVSNSQRELPVPPGVRVLQLGKNLGFARAANAGARVIQGDLLLLNDDTRLDAHCLAALRRGPARGAVLQPRLVLTDGRLDNLGHGFFPDGFVWARGRNGPNEAPSGIPGGFSGAAVLFPKLLWEALGGFDERFDSFGEDVDLSLRLMRRGVPVCPVADAIVYHHLGASYGRTSGDKIRRIERNRVRAAVRSLPFSALLSLPALTMGRYALLGGLALSGKGPGAGVSKEGQIAAIRGMLEGFLDAPEWWIARKADQGDWVRGEREMWKALWEGRVRWEDLRR